MTKRPERGIGLFYHRDSEGHSTLVPPQYVEGAKREAERLGVAFSGTPAAITAMIENGVYADGDLYLDFGVSGDVLRRPGLDALRARALGDPKVTHLFVPRRDRIARPSNPNDGLEIERELRTAGLTLVFLDGVTLAPTLRGAEIDLGEQIVGMIDYHNSGRFRRELAEKQIHSKLKLASWGFSIGGEPPYGFRRWLAGEDGTPKRELEDHERVHLPGHHVVWLPTATDEMKVVLRILDLIMTTPASRIARMLNAEGIPSPHAGRVRTRNGVKIELSGEWTENTVRNVSTNPLLIGVCEYGRHAEGDQRRLTPNGPRALGEGDYHPDGKPKTVINSDDQIIRTPAKSKPVTTQEHYDRIKEVIEARGRHLKGKARTRGQSPNPLGGRIFDLNCGWLMFRNAKRKKWCYGCGLYQNSQAKCCRHNLVEGEKASRFVLACLRQRLLSPATLLKLKSRLQELAAAEQGEDADQRQLESDRLEFAALQRKVKKVAENMALAESREERDATAAVFRNLKEQESALDRRIRSQRQVSQRSEPEKQVEAALGTLERLTEWITNGTVDWSVIGGAFSQTNAKLYLRFAEVEQGRKKINVPAGGVVTFGSTPPPGSLYTGPTDRTSIRKRLAAGEPVAAIPECVAPGNSDSGQDVIWSANVQSRKRLGDSGFREFPSDIGLAIVRSSVDVCDELTAPAGISATGPRSAGFFSRFAQRSVAMFRPNVAMCAVLLLSITAQAADPKPLWELSTSTEKQTRPGWLGYSPDGKAIISVMVQAEPSESLVYTYTLRVWDASTRKERFSAEIGRGKPPAFGDDFVAFPTDDSILTGGHSLVTRSLFDGREIENSDTGGTTEFAVWSVRDLRETFHLNREPDRDGNPVQLSFRSRTDFNYEEEFTKRVRGDDRTVQVTTVKPPRTGLRPQSITLNPGRNRLVAAFRDETSPVGQAQHSLVQYRIDTIDGFDLERVAEAVNPHAGSVSALVFAQDGKTLATGGEDGTICLWNVKETPSQTWAPRATLTAGDQRVVSVAFSPDWRMVAAITWDAKKPNLYLIDADAGTVLRSVKLEGELTTLAWATDGKTLLTGSQGGKLAAWDVAALLK